jgi:hypothetical protein
MEIINKAQCRQVELLCFYSGVSKIVVEFSKGSHECEHVAIFATVETNPVFTYFQRNLGDLKQRGIGGILWSPENSKSKIW